jgi:hypothetical protein
MTANNGIDLTRFKLPLILQRHLPCRSCEALPINQYEFIQLQYAMLVVIMIKKE